MKSFIALVLLFGLAVASDVLEFDDSNFDDQVAEHDTVLVEFFAPWCGHCKKLAPEYETAATDLANDDPPIALAKVDCVGAGKEACSKHGVSGYPTLKIFKGGQLASDYNGPRDARGISSFMRKQAGPSAKELSTVKATEDFINEYDPRVIGFFSEKDSKDHKEFMKAASSLSEDFRLAYTTEKDVMEKFGYTDKVVIFRATKQASKFEESTVVFDGEIKGRSISTWVKENVNGLCGLLTPDNQDLFNKPLVVAYFNVDYKKNAKGTNYWRNRVMKIGKKYVDQGVTFAIASIDDFAREVGEFGFTDASGDPPIVGARSADGGKYAMQDKFSMDALDKFVSGFLAGDVEPYLKSDPIPESNDDPVKVVVGKNFNDIVMDDTKDVLIEFYAPWCGHCKSLEPKYNELAEKLKDDPNVVIAKMDATANDSPGAFDVRGFPTLYWVPKSNTPKKYEGGREVDNFVDFIKRESSFDSVNVSGEATKKDKKKKKGKKTEL
ncbi:protein disulfide-isomerase A3-like isoform X2 [Amphiura filiformis]|uniref:protein disulfide-isomerase A3-like isoform X2 n=1 Tax=Amphiura filiformis TaxID=82378 RepID=UPI003B216CAF